jgi:hypothetical protein
MPCLKGGAIHGKFCRSMPCLKGGAIHGKFCRSMPYPKGRSGCARLP